MYQKQCAPPNRKQIREAFTASKQLSFSARHSNYFKWRRVRLHGRLWLSLERLCRALEIDAHSLQPVFGGKPQHARDYKRLLYFPMTWDGFTKLAKLLDKPIQFWQEDGSSGDHYYMGTVFPSGWAKKSKLWGK